jgi:hypothetical protein
MRRITCGDEGNAETMRGACGPSDGDHHDGISLFLDPGGRRAQTPGEVFRKVTPSVVVIKAKGRDVSAGGQVRFLETGKPGSEFTAAVLRGGRIVELTGIVP